MFKPAFLLLPLAVLGAVRAPVPGAVALAVLALHSVVPHKEPRFVYLALAVAPGLIAIGAADLLRRLPRPALGAGAALTAWCALSWLGATGPLAGRWSFHRPTIEAFAAAGRAPGLTGLGVAAPGENGHAAYVHLHRDVPLFFEKPELEIEIDGAPVHLPFEVARQGARAPLGRLSPDGPHSHLIAATAPPGFETVWCYAPARPSAEPPPCLHRRR